MRSLLPFLWPKDNLAARMQLVAAMAALILSKVAMVYVPVVYSQAVDALTPHGPQGLIYLPLALVAGYTLLRVTGALFGELRDALFAQTQAQASRMLGLETFRHLHTLSMRFHLDRQTGGLGRNISRGVTAVEQVLRFAVFNILPTLIEILLVIGILWVLFDWRFALVAFAAVGIYILFTVGFASWRIRFRRTMNDMDTETQNRTVDSLLNFETVKYFGNEALEAERVDESLRRYARSMVKTQISLNLLNIGQAVIISIGLGAIMLMAAQGVVEGRYSVGRFVLVNTYLMQLYLPLNFLGFVYNTIRQGLVDMEQMFRLMEVEQEVKDRPGALTLPATLDGGAPASLVFDDVWFGYHEERPILRGVSFAVPPGGTLAIVGPTGAGKSTISRLLFRFYDPGQGRVMIDGHDIRDLTQQSLRAAIGVVPQDTVLFNDTIRYNIAYGRPGASQAEIEHAARLAQVHDFVLRLPEGYDTRVGERGLKLSGGEKQRVAIARTILKNPRILILDEATSALDTRTEQEIGAALRAVSQARTTLIIAHRLSTVVDADSIIVLSEGTVIEQGTHAELLAKAGVYAHMWDAQQEQPADLVPV
nr:ABC transporter ATP-binding protein/permease [Granulibacter bethesdensis]